MELANPRGRVAILFVVIAVATGLIAWSVFHQFRVVSLNKKDHDAGNAYQKAFQQRLANIEDSLNQCERQYGRYPRSVEEWTSMDPQASSMLAPIPHAAAPFEIHLELMDRKEKLLLIIEPGFSHVDGSGTWYLGYSIFNTPRTFHWPYDANDVARTREILATLSPTLAADIRLTSTEANITPEAIAASGLQAFDDEIVQSLTGVEGEYQAIAQLRVQLTEASYTLTQASKVLARDPSEVEARQLYAAAQNQIANLRAEIITARQTLFALATTTLSTEDRQKLEVFQLSTGRAVPPAFQVKSRTDAQWSDIERALIAERRAQRLGQQVPSAVQSLLAAVRAEPEVVQAQANLEQHLAGVQAAFAVAVSPATQPR